MDVTANSLVPFLVAVSFAAGLNVYATTGALGLLSHFRLVELPPGLDVLGNRWVIAASLLCFACEFFADKIPYVDLVWNIVHTFVRIPVAAVLAYRASMGLPPEMRWAAAALGAGVATVAHTSKIAARTLVSASPEPATNIGLSSGEDAVTIGLVWLATKHPWAAGAAAGVLLLTAVMFARWIVRVLRRQIQRVGGGWNRAAGGAGRRTPGSV
jgi:ABC-type Co2+ transport system permease subunit